MIAIDESSAFDSLSHEILLQKLSLYRMSKDTINWINDYLSAISQYVTLGAKDSIIKSVTTGVLQGSILSPIFLVKKRAWSPSLPSSVTFFTSYCTVLYCKKRTRWLLGSSLDAATWPPGPGDSWLLIGWSCSTRD